MYPTTCNSQTIKVQTYSLQQNRNPCSRSVHSSYQTPKRFNSSRVLCNQRGRLADTQPKNVVWFRHIRCVETVKSKTNLLDDYKDCFGELGTLQEKYHIVTDPKVPPVIEACRNVPISLRDKRKAELKQITYLNVITQVTEPTDWVPSLVVAYKPSGALRVCLDQHNLNKAIKRHHHKLPTPEEILKCQGEVMKN